ncbi:DUF4328 domain-containing protein [Kribbella steppae]|uniref:DUF4328 domain-containing protein n=1 Tax=Kribbella steppae TaxID=2512223 RepID=UPI001F54636E|nr:DUF4328 domain-containing protein [Kribbella steppae]
MLTAVQDHEEEWQPHAAEEFQQVGTVGKIAIGLLGASTLTHLLSTWSDWNTYSVVNSYLGGMPNVDDADLNRADAIAKVTAVPNVVISVAAAVVFVIWLWRARVNSEVFCQADHRRSHGWVLASWFCPGPNLWYPKQIVDDVWLASDPKTPVYADDLRRFRTPALTSVWWVAWVGALAFDVVVRRFLMWMDATVGSLRGIALAGSASLVLTAASAVAATLVIRKINAMQTSREWIPWWDQSGPKLTAVPSYEVHQVPSYANDDTDEQAAISEPIAAPVRQLERQPELQMAGGGPAPSPFASAPAAGAGFPGDGAAAGGFPGGGSPFGAGQAPVAFGGAPAGFGGAPAAFGGDSPVEEPPKWSPFAPVVESWQDDKDNGPSTEQFDAVAAWQEEKQPVEEGTSYEKTSWSDYLGSGNDDLLSTQAPSSSNWLDETPPLTVVEPEPYSYQPSQPAAPYQPSQPAAPYQPSQPAAPYQPSQPAASYQPTQPAASYQPSQPAAEAPSWASSYSESYSYETPDYLTSAPTPAEVEPAPEPEPAPVARAGRRAARVAVDSPSAIQPVVSSQAASEHTASEHTVYAPSEHTVYAPTEHTTPSSPVSASSGYYEPAPVIPQQDDFLTPSKPLPTVPSYGPEPSYTDNSYSSEPTYSSYEDSSSSYQPSYDSSPEYTSYGQSDHSSTANYESTDYSYGSSTSSSSEYNYDSTSYDSYSPTSYSGSEYNSVEPTYESYSPNYATESYSPSADYSSNNSYYSPEEPQQQPEYQQQAPYSYEQQQAPEQGDQTNTTPRTHPRRRWV